MPIAGTYIKQLVVVHIDVEHMVDADGNVLTLLQTAPSVYTPRSIRPVLLPSCLPPVRTRDLSFTLLIVPPGSVVVTVYSCSILVPATESTGCFPLIGCVHFLYLFYFYIDYMIVGPVL